MRPELITAAVRGDPGATEGLLRLLHPVVLRYCVRRLGGRDHRATGAEDCTQDVLVAVLAALPRYRYPADRFLSFVFGIAGHKIVDVYRGRAGDRTEPVPDFGEGHGDRGRDEIELADQQLTLSWLLGRLPPRHREVLAMRVLFGYSAEETAATLGMPSAGAVRVTQHRALTTLREALAGEVTDGTAGQRSREHGR
ncbi:sigma-70 family RNA polymerase sigma factor [Amycolatopsis sp. CA-230715]|uniref:sigma-70 family RNA polymerase sigma factor n=1 Tax=Amycolatopsis sp. CA-230715 TaxID=2745196 RepID=UPI001C012883|nr:sigma-70 family RNA polymerase sigma factor [Amycolatopsis sp. CA-230715]